MAYPRTCVESFKVSVRVSGTPSNPSVKRRAKFPRSLRLLRHSDFERVYEHGRRHFSPSLTVFYRARPSEEPAAGLRVGFTVGRALGGAVERNRIKRRLREAVRLSRPLLGICADMVINPKKSVLTAEFDVVLNEVRRAFVVIEGKLADKGKPPSDASPGKTPVRSEAPRELSDEGKTEA
jgi:ribonuclease P protein component